MSYGASYGYDPRQQQAAYPPQQFHAAPGPGSYGVPYQPPQPYAPHAHAPQAFPQQQYAAPPSPAYAPAPYAAAAAPLFSPSQVNSSDASPAEVYGGSAGAKLLNATSATAGGMRDKAWLLLFVLHLLFIFIVEGIYGSKYMADINQGVKSSLASDQGKTVIGMLCTSAVIGTLTAAVWMKVMSYMTGKVVLVSVVGNVVLSIASAAWFFASGISGLGVTLLFWSIILCVWAFFARSRIPLAEAVLHSASQSVKDVWGPFIVTYIMSVISILWTVNWAFTVTSVLVVYIMSTSSTTFEQAALWILVASFYWVGNTVRGIIHFTTAGSVASWWLVSEVQSPTWGSFKRSVTTSLGTVIVGSLLVSIVDFLLFVIRYCARCVCFCLAGLIQRLARYFNSYVLILSSMYGLSYFDAAKAVRALMAAKFWELLTTNTLTRAVFFLSALLSGVISGAVSVVWLNQLKSDDPLAAPYLKIALPIICWYVGFQMSSLFMAVLDSAVNTSLVCWAEDPLSMQRNRPEHFAKMNAAAQLAYPAEYASAFPALAAQQVHVVQQQQLPYYQPQPQYGVQQPPPHY